MLVTNLRTDLAPHRGVVRAASTAAAVILAVAGCGGSSGNRVSQPPSNPSANAPSASGVVAPLAYARCMRSHGVPRFPDPTSRGAIPKTSLDELGVSSSQFQAA
jgi:hypothetical protein